MSRCYHCGEVDAHCYLCRDCGQIYCILHKDPDIHECSLVREELRYPQDLDQLQGQMGANGSDEEGSEVRGRSDGCYTWYRHRGWVVTNNEESKALAEEEAEKKRQEMYRNLLIMLVVIIILSYLSSYLFGGR
jgi:hypothetical protein